MVDEAADAEKSAAVGAASQWLQQLQQQEVEKEDS